MTRLAGRVGRCSKRHGSVRVGSRCVQYLTDRVWSIQELFYSRGSVQIRKKIFQTSRKNLSNLTCRVGSGQEFFKAQGSGQVGSGHDSRSCVLLTRRSNPRIRPSQKLPLFVCPQRLLSHHHAILSYSFGCRIQTLKDRQIFERMPASIHTRYGKATYHCGVQARRLTCSWSIDPRAGPAGRTRGSRETVSWVEVTRPAA